MKLVNWVVRFGSRPLRSLSLVEMIARIRVLSGDPNYLSDELKKYRDYQQRVSELEQEVNKLLRDLKDQIIDKRQAIVLEQLIETDPIKRGKVTFQTWEFKLKAEDDQDNQSKTANNPDTLSKKANDLIDVYVARGVYISQFLDQRNEIQKLLNKLRTQAPLKKKVRSQIQNLRNRSKKRPKRPRSVIDQWPIDVRPFSKFQTHDKRWSGERTDRMMNMSEVNIRIPNNLRTDQHCMAILGYQLDNQGNLQKVAIDRLKKAKELAKAYPKSKIICSGGAPRKDDVTNRVTEAQAMANWLIREGISPERILLEDKSTDTIENAMNTIKMMNKEGIRDVTVVTSVSHMRRALNDFYEANDILQSEFQDREFTHVASEDIQDPKEPLTVEQKIHMWRDLLRMNKAYKYASQFRESMSNNDREIEVSDRG